MSSVYSMQAMSILHVHGDMSQICVTEELSDVTRRLHLLYPRPHRYYKLKLNASDSILIVDDNTKLTMTIITNKIKTLPRITLQDKMIHWN